MVPMLNCHTENIDLKGHKFFQGNFFNELIWFLTINDQLLDVIDSTKLLSTIISNTLSWDQTTAYIVKKANSRMQLLRKVASKKPS